MTKPITERTDTAGLGRGAPKLVPVTILSTLLLAVTVTTLASRAAPVAGRILPGLVVTAAFAVLAYALKAVTRSGALAGALISFLLFVSGGAGAFAALVAVFLLAWISTRLGYARKQALGRAESRSGRSAAQVLANLTVAAACAGLSAIAYPAFRPSGHGELWLIAAAAALAEAAADTVSSECGEAWSERVRLITTGRPVPPGTDGGVSVAGTAAGIVGAALVASVCVLTQLTPGRMLPIITGAAVLGMFFDSLLGATFERWRLVGNNTVNFASTLFAAVAAALTALWK